jgi:hypothetical protein
MGKNGLSSGRGTQFTREQGDESMLGCHVSKQASAKAVATVLLDFRAHPETAGPL